MEWKHAYVYGDYGHLRDELIKVCPPDAESDKDYTVQGQHAYKCPVILQPMEQTGTDEEIGSPIYSIIEGRADVLCFVAYLTEEGEAILKHFEALDGVFVHREATIDELKELYPEHTRCAVPHF